MSALDFNWYFQNKVRFSCCMLIVTACRFILLRSWFFTSQYVVTCLSSTQSGTLMKLRETLACGSFWIFSGVHSKGTFSTELHILISSVLKNHSNKNANFSQCFQFPSCLKRKMHYLNNIFTLVETLDCSKIKIVWWIL